MSKLLYIEDYQELFEAVQKAQIFEDQKTMADALPLLDITEINSRYEAVKNEHDFDLKKFVLQYFKFESIPDSRNLHQDLPILDHIEELWDHLTRFTPVNKGTLLAVPHSYIVPGGRFVEFFYWDSYFVMLGLKESGRLEMMKNIVDNCAYLISEFGFVPNASRSYFLTRSQPPYFSLMVELLVETLDDKSLYANYFEALLKEYDFWMDYNGEQKRTVSMPDGILLNRYFDDKNEPRPESYEMDFSAYQKSSDPNFYQNVRAACESGWDFSSRWFGVNNNFNSIVTLSILPVDLNCLLYHLESTIGKSAEFKENETIKTKFFSLAEKRKQAIKTYFWNEEHSLYFDYNISLKSQTSSEHIGTLYPLFVGISTSTEAEKVLHSIQSKFLHKGGLVNTTFESGEQWDFPNAWAPFQWLGYVSATKYGDVALATAIKENWCANVERVYKNTGKLMEKYNAVDLSLIAGGGEYPNQDGFGWTNGVYAAFKKNINN